MAEQKVKRRCSHCKATLIVPASALGKKGKCPHCGNVILLKRNPKSAQSQEPIIELESEPLIDPDRDSSTLSTSRRMPRCRTCGKQVSKRAKSCPQCGEVNPSHSGFRAGCNAFFTVIIVLCFLLWLLFDFPGCEIRGIITRFR